MKKQILILATVMTTVAFVSCSKEKIETPQANISEEIATARKPGGGGGSRPVSDKGLLGRFEFNSNLRDTTNQLIDADPTIDRVLFTSDRKGQINNAIRFNGAYGLDIFDIPFTPENCSVSIWVKDNVTEGPSWISILTSSNAFNLIQNELEFNCSFWKFGYGIIQQVGTAPVDDQWHHIAATRDNNTMKLYIDGVLIGTSPSPAGSLPYTPLHNYLLGYGGGTYWNGSADDLRFYARVLSAAEINTLANQ